MGLDSGSANRHPGLSFEKIHDLIDERSGEQLYFLLNAPVLLLVSLHTQHDEAYRRGR